MTTPTAVIYARQSLDRSGDALAVTRQLDLCRKFAAERGWEITEEYVDNDISATTGVSRPSFNRMLRTKPERVVVWHIDRLIRLTKDLERVIDVGSNVHAVRAGHLDLSNPAGRAVARTVTAWATYEGEQKAERQKASNDQRAAAGRPSAGRRCFGYSGDGMQILEAEAVHTRAAVKAIIEGIPLRAVVKQMNAAGARTTAGNLWGPSEVRRYLVNPRLAAFRVHRGEVVGRGVWPPIISEDDHGAVCAILKDPARRPKGRPRAYLLSGIAKCGQCGGRIYGRIERRGPIYVCEAKAHLGRKIADIDKYVEDIIVARLSLPDAAAAFIDPERSDRAAALRAEKAKLTARLDDLAETFAAGEISRQQLTAGTAALRGKIDKIDAELPSLASSPAVATLLDADDILVAWDALETETKREIVGMLAEVTIHPAGRGARHFREETVTITPKG